MPNLIAMALYGIIILIYLTTCFFIIYHLANFSVHTGIKIIALLIFITAASTLLALNALAFFSINWDNLLSNLIAF